MEANNQKLARIRKNFYEDEFSSDAEFKQPALDKTFLRKAVFNDYVKPL